MTPMIELIPSTSEFFLRGKESNNSLASFLGIIVPEEWPPRELSEEVLVEFYEEHSLRAIRDDLWGTWLIAIKDPQPILVGFIVLCQHGERRGEIAFEILPEFRNRGIARKAAQIAIEKLFAVDSIQEVEALWDNPITPDVLEPLGFKRHGEHGGWHILTRSDWKGNQSLGV